MRDPEKQLTPLQRTLYELMSEISEDCWCAGWMMGNEFSLWDAIVTGDRTYGMAFMDEWLLASCKALAEQIGGWIEWRDDEQGLTNAEWGPYFIAMPEWLDKFAKDKAGRDALGAKLAAVPSPGSVEKT
jgi:hypothetical protein